MSQGKIQQSFDVRWADLDPNWHLKNTAYSEYSTQLRFNYLNDNGFGGKQFQKLQIGPVIFREDIRYLKEVQYDDVITVDLRATGLSVSGHMWSVRQVVTRGDGAVAAILNLSGAWLNLVKRKIVVPPEELRELLAKLPKTDDYATIE